MDKLNDSQRTCPVCGKDLSQRQEGEGEPVFSDESGQYCHPHCSISIIGEKTPAKDDTSENRGDSVILDMERGDVTLPISTEIEEEKFMARIDTLETNINELVEQMKEQVKAVKELQKKIPITPTLPIRQPITIMLIVLAIIMVFTGFLVLRVWFLPPEAQVNVSYNYTVNVGETIGLTLAGFGGASAGVAYALGKRKD